MCSRTIRPNSRCLSFFVFILVAAGATSVAGAAESSPGDLGDPVAPGDPSDKPDSHIGTNPARDGREGGETIADAIFIPEPWFQDTGATCDNIDDYDEICPYPGSTSPDVVYSLEYYGCVYLAVDLYGSSYDTKVYIYDDQMNVLACNDDYYSDFTSRVELYGDYTGIIYIVVDGYGGDCGEYVMFVEGGSRRHHTMLNARTVHRSNRNHGRPTVTSTSTTAVARRIFTPSSSWHQCPA